MSDVWNIIITRNREYRRTLTFTTPLPTEVLTATEWRVDLAMPNEAPFCQASIANGMLVAGVNGYQKILVIPASVNATFPTGNGRFEWWIEFAGGRKVTYLRGQCSVLPQIGEVTP
jgi:hypothetical protein